jgi:hypothetical protein
MVSPLLWALFFTPFFTALQANASPQPYPDDFRLLYSVFFLPRIISPYGQQNRAEKIGDADFIQGHDLIILNQLFDGAPSATLLNRLKGEYPHQTPVLASAFSRWDSSLGTGIRI